MSQRILTPETVSAMIPLLQRVADDLDAAYRAAAELLDGPGGVQAGAELSDRLDRVQEFVDEMEHLGGTMRAYEPVRIDFIAEVDGEIGYVCWESGDREAAHFHPATASCGRPALSA